MSTAGYVKLLLPPRQSRGNSHWGLGRPAVLGQATPKERTDSQISAPSPVVEAVPLLSRRLRVDAASGETPKAAPTSRGESPTRSPERGTVTTRKRPCESLLPAVLPTPDLRDIPHIREMLFGIGWSWW